MASLPYRKTAVENGDGGDEAAPWLLTEVWDSRLLLPAKYFSMLYPLTKVIFRKQEWIDKLKEWGCYKNLPKDAWRYVNHQTRKRRRSDGGGDACVVLSGVRLSQSQVQKGVRNHCPGPTLKVARHRCKSGPATITWIRKSEC